MSASSEVLDGAQGPQDSLEVRQDVLTPIGPQAATQEAVEPEPGAWTIPVLAGLGLAVSIGVLAWWSGWPVWGMALAVLAAAGLGVLGVLDARTMLVRDRHNQVFIVVALAGVAAAAMVTGDWMIAVFGLASGAFAFVFLFVMMLCRITGAGDVKLVASPAMLLGAFNPLVFTYWMLGCLVLWLAVNLTMKARSARGKSVSEKVPMVPLMALSLIPAVPAAGLFLSSLGLA
ncbi:hypothetical protein LG293_16175 (plasmid) [Citricoccus nitrophenolicus]